MLRICFVEHVFDSPKQYYHIVNESNMLYSHVTYAFL